MTLGEESARIQRDEKKSEYLSQIHLRNKNAASRPQRVVKFNDTSQTHLRRFYMANRLQRTLHADEMETSELHRNV